MSFGSDAQPFRRRVTLAVAAVVALAASVPALAAGRRAAPPPPPNPPLYTASAYVGKAHLRHFVALAKAHPKNLTDQFEAAVASFNNDLPHQAIAYYQACLKIDPSFGEAWNDIGNVYRLQLRDPEKELQAYQKATQVEPGYGYGWYNLALFYQTEHKNAEAAAVARQALKVLPKSDPLYPFFKQKARG